MASNSASMQTQTLGYVGQSASSASWARSAAVLAGRALFAVIFILSGPQHFLHRTIAFAAQQGVPLASIAVPLSGVIALAGGLSVLLGYKAKWGAWLLI